MVKQVDKNKFSTDLIWNITAFGGIVVLGILLNILIIKFYNAAVLGVFNQVYAIYILFSQLAVGGVHLSVQYLTPKYASSSKIIAQVTVTALIIALLFSTGAIMLGYALTDVLGEILKSTGVSEGLKYTLWGLLFFSFNKILLAMKNGLRAMKTFAIGQLLRFVFIFMAFLYLTTKGFSTTLLPSVFAIAELALFIVLFLLSIKELSYFSGKGIRRAFKLNLKYGNNAFTGNILLDVNTKVDVFTLGVFLSDTLVGIYSFAATIAEGFMQLPVLYRNNLNPVITRLHSGKNELLTTKILKRNIKVAYKYLGVLGILSIACFPIVPWLFGIEEIKETLIVYSILIGGIIVTAGYQPLLMIFNQLGKPGLQTKYFFLIFSANVIFNFSFVPLIGIYGAALGTALSFFVQVFFLKYYLSRKFKLHV